MTYRKPEEIIHKGVKLSDALEAHRLWLSGSADGQRIDWTGADLDRASLDHASLNGASLDHASLNGASLDRASLNYASLNGAWLDHASLNDAWLNRASGNMMQIKSAQFDKWAITWTCDADGQTTLQIGCQNHVLDLWEKSDPRWIATLDDDATEWWSKYRDVVLGLVHASPAVKHAGKGT